MAIMKGDCKICDRENIDIYDDGQCLICKRLDNIEKLLSTLPDNKESK